MIKCNLHVRKMEIQKTLYAPPQQLTMNSDDSFNFIDYKILNFLIYIFVHIIEILFIYFI